MTGLWERIGSFQTQHKRAHDHQRAYGIMITTTVSERIIRLIVEKIIMSHMGIAYRVEHTAQGTRRTTVSVFWSVLSVRT